MIFPFTRISNPPYKPAKDVVDYGFCVFLGLVERLLTINLLLKDL